MRESDKVRVSSHKSVHGICESQVRGTDDPDFGGAQRDVVQLQLRCRQIQHFARRQCCRIISGVVAGGTRVCVRASTSSGPTTPFPRQRPPLMQMRGAWLMPAFGERVTCWEWALTGMGESERASMGLVILCPSSPMSPSLTPRSWESEGNPRVLPSAL